MKSPVAILALSLWVAVCIDVSQTDIDVMNDVVVDHQAWLRDAWGQKVDNAEEIVIKKEIRQSIEERKPIDLSKPDKVIRDRFDRPGYKNRKKRGTDE